MAVPLVRQGQHPNDDDYYVILDVDFKATQEEITSAYRSLARRFHPDKHNQDERSRKEAQVIFQRIKSAYEVLSDPHKRQIYDTLGPEGLKLDGWKLVRKQMTAQEIREEYLRLQRQSLENKHAAIAKPRASFTMHLDASEIFRRDKLDDEFIEYEEESLAYSFLSSLTSVEIRSLSAAMSVENNLDTNHAVTLSGNLKTENGNGDGSFGTIYKYKYSPHTFFNILFQVGRGPVLATTLTHQLNERTSVSARGLLLLDTYSIVPGIKLTLAHKIRNYLIGKISYKEGTNPSVTTSLIYFNERLLLEVTTSYKLSRLNHGVSIDFGYRFNKDGSKLTVSLAAASNQGLAVEYGCETTLFEINVIGAALSFSLEAGVTLKIRYSRANQEFNIPIYLSDEVHSGPLFYGTMVPLIAYYIADRCYIRHYKRIN